LQQALAARGPTLAGPGDNDGLAPAAVQPAAIPEELRPLVQQQLEAGASNRLVWQGEVWPNQMMDWEIHRDPSGAAETPEPADVWQTRLRLSLPLLGEIDVRLQLSGAVVNVMLEATAAASGARLEAALPGLQQSFSAAGLKLAGAQVKRDESP
jgi:flagellar hook-length control protein FliK